jgi:hypothetical protein
MANPRFAFTRKHALMMLAGRVGLTLQQTVIDFQTIHRFCETCVSRTKRSRALSVLTKSIAFFLLIVSTGMALIGGGAAIIFWADRKDRHEFLGWLVVGTAGMIASIFGHIWKRRLRIPEQLRAVGRKPFWLEKVVDYDNGR